MTVAPRQLIEFWRELSRFHVPAFDPSATKLHPGREPWFTAAHHHGNWFHHLYFGRVDAERRHELLQPATAVAQGDRRDATMQGDSYLLRATVDKNGIFVEGSFFCSPWLRNLAVISGENKKSSLKHYLLASKTLHERWLRLWRTPDQKQDSPRLATYGRCLTAARELFMSMDRIPDWIQEMTADIYVHSLELPPLPLFDEVVPGAQAFEAYMTGIKEKRLQQLGTRLKQLEQTSHGLDRIDVLEERRQLLSMVQPRYWPAASTIAEQETGLALCEQAAVNEIVKPGHKNFAVHAPIGSDKQRIMDEVCAAQLLDLGKHIAGYDHPSQVEDSGEAPLFLLRTHHTAFTNRPVAIDQSAPKLERLAALVLAHWRRGAEDTMDAQAQLLDLMRQLAAVFDTTDTDHQAWLNLWRESRQRFSDNLAEAGDFFTQADHSSQYLMELLHVSEKCERQKVRYEQARDQFHAIADQYRRIDGQKLQLEQQLEMLQQQQQTLEKEKPMKLLIQTSGYKSWEQQLQQCKQNIAQARENEIKVRERHRALSAQYNHHEKDHGNQQTEWEQLVERQQQLQTNVQFLRDNRVTVPDENFARLGKTQQLLQKLWTNPAIKKVRRRLFAHGCALWAATILYRHATGKTPGKIAHGIISGDVQTLASIYRQSTLPHPRLALVDRAESAMLLRLLPLLEYCPRLVCLGDPCLASVRVEGRIGTPETLAQTLPGYHPESWQLSQRNLLGLQQQHTALGTAIEHSRHQRQWTGFPLRGVSIADPLLLQLANQLFYGRQLFASNIPPVNPPGRLPPSRWFGDRMQQWPDLLHKSVAAGKSVLVLFSDPHAWELHRAVCDHDHVRSAWMQNLDESVHDVVIACFSGECIEDPAPVSAYVNQMIMRAVERLYVFAEDAWGTMPPLDRVRTGLHEEQYHAVNQLFQESSLAGEG